MGTFAPWLLLIAVGFLIPAMGMQLYGVRHVDPGRAGILLQAEIVFGVASAAVLTTEPFGWREIVGTLLVLAAGLTEVFANPAPRDPLPTCTPGRDGTPAYGRPEAPTGGSPRRGRSRAAPRRVR